MHLSYSSTITEQSQVLATMPHCKLVMLVIALYCHARLCFMMSNKPDPKWPSNICNGQVNPIMA